MTNELIFNNQFYYLFPKWNDVLHAKLVLKGTFQGEEEHNVERFKTWTARRNALSVRDLKSSTLHRMLSQTRVCQLFQQLKSISVVVFLLVLYCSAVILWDMQPKISVRNCSTLLYLKLIAVSGHCTHTKNPNLQILSCDGRDILWKNPKHIWTLSTQLMWALNLGRKRLILNGIKKSQL